MAPVPPQWLSVVSSPETDKSVPVDQTPARVNFTDTAAFPPLNTNKVKDKVPVEVPVKPTEVTAEVTVQAKTTWADLAEEESIDVPAEEGSRIDNLEKAVVNTASEIAELSQQIDSLSEQKKALSKQQDALSKLKAEKEAHHAELVVHVSQEKEAEITACRARLLALTSAAAEQEKLLQKLQGTGTGNATSSAAAAAAAAASPRVKFTAVSGKKVTKPMAEAPVAPKYVFETVLGKWSPNPGTHEYAHPFNFKENVRINGTLLEVTTRDLDNIHVLLEKYEAQRGSVNNNKSIRQEDMTKQFIWHLNKGTKDIIKQVLDTDLTVLDFAARRENGEYVLNKNGRKMPVLKIHNLYNALKCFYTTLAVHKTE